MTLNNPGCFYSGTIQHELMHILGKKFVFCCSSLFEEERMRMSRYTHTNATKC